MTVSYTYIMWLCSLSCVFSSPTYHCEPPKPHLHQSPFPGSWLLVWFYDTLNLLRTTCVPLEPGGVISGSTAAGKDSPLPASTPDCQGLTLVQNRCIHSSCEIRIAITAPVQETAFCSPAPYHLDLQPFYPLLQHFLSLSRVVEMSYLGHVIYHSLSALYTAIVCIHYHSLGKCFSDEGWQ